MKSCKKMTLSNGETVQYIPKPIPPDVKWLTKSLPRCHSIPHDARQFYCTIPACHSRPCLHGGSCEETNTGYTCLCLDGYRGSRCEHDMFIQSLKVLGPDENPSEGPLALTSRLLDNEHVLIHLENWKSNYSQLACQHLGFEGSFATLSGAQYDSVDTPSEVATIICPDDVMNLTECWTNETRVVVNKNHTIAVVCCPVSPCSPSGQALGIADDAYSESSCSSTSNCGSAARLDGTSIWRPSLSNDLQWIQVQLEYSIVTAITIQGNASVGINEWMTSFTISSSLDGANWNDYVNVYSGLTEIFPGNYDLSSHVTHTFIRPIVCRYFRLNPRTFETYIAVGMELYGYGPLTDVVASLNLAMKPGCSPPVLGEGLGVEDGRIPDSSLTSSTVINAGNHVPSQGRLNSNSAWIPLDSDTNKWVKTYPANFDQDTYVTIVFPKPVTARYVRIHTPTYNHHASMRFEVLGINN
ncbi:coagulation factor VIII-like [Lytechinus variegatus]|uniref:coagulation factor VIII-like n=1 Tax=Lytechinus variegatus TaxID=7654 RepID=UPI001BB1B7F9|nr:coagulation factor VIII-like [Lytechinus variegatus]